MSQLVLERLRARFGEKILSTSSFRGDDEAIVAPADWLEVATFLRDEPECAMDHFVDLTAVDYPEREPELPRFDVVLFVRSLAKKRSIALMNDQKYNDGLAVPFFGYECMTADGPTRLALKFGVPLIPITGRRIEGTRFVATAYPPIKLDYTKPDDPQTVYNGVKRVNEFMEARVREAPGQWFWPHRRWPKEAWAKAGVM